MRLDLLQADFEFDRKDGTGRTLRELGLIELCDVGLQSRGYDFEVVPTDRLRAMFGGSIDLAAVYPLLVELTVSCKDSTVFINQRHVEWRLRQAGMTPDGLELLEAMLAGQAGRTD